MVIFVKVIFVIFILFIAIEKAQNDFGVIRHEGCLFLHYATNHKPGMNEEGDRQTIMGAHHMETLTK